MKDRPLIGVTIGDPASVGPEITAKALKDESLYEICRPLVIGDGGVMRKAMELAGYKGDLHVVQDPGEGRYEPGAIDLYDLANVDVQKLRMGEVQAVAGRAAYEYIEKSIRLAQAKEIDAVATAPINKVAIKAAGLSFIGHTEMFGELTGSPSPLTMFQVENLKIFFLSRHLSLRQACDFVTRENVLKTLIESDKALKELGFAEPRIAVAGLNPHAGDNGLFGDEEAREITPAIQDAVNRGIKASGPIAADSVFQMVLRGRFDAVLSLYHDQGHIASKVYDMERTVSVTAGLPFIRTSVDHGTAFDIAGKGVASAVSMVEAIRVAAEYAAITARN